MTDTRSNDPKQLSVTLRVPSLKALFDAPEVDPFSPDFQPYSHTAAVEYLADLLYSDRRIERVNATFVFPPDVLASTSQGNVKEAIGRYVDSKIEDYRTDVSSHWYRGRRALLIGIIGLFVLIALALAVRQLWEDNNLAEILATGLEIGGWALLWFPIDLVVWNVWGARNDRKVYQRIKDGTFTLTSDPSTSS